MKTPLITGLQENLLQDLPKAPQQKKQIVQKQHRVDDSHVFDMMDALQAPILTFSPHWKDTIPRRILDLIPLARMAALLKKEEMATLEECCVYIYTRTLDAPMDHEWVDIYTHVSCTVLQQWFKEDHWEEVRAPKELSDWLKSKLNGLRKHIYNKRRELLKQHLKGQRKTDTL